MAYNEDTKPGSKFYLTNKEILPEVINCKKTGVISDKLWQMLVLLVERYGSKGNFYGYSYNDDMQGEALCSLMKNALKFDPERSSNPFAFYTSCVHNSFLGYMAHEKKQQRIRDKLLVEAGESPSYNFQEEYRDNIRNSAIADDMRELAGDIAAAKERLSKSKEFDMEQSDSEDNSKLISFD